jgi:uncharacterized protein YyaL (SSP411 family)
VGAPDDARTDALLAAAWSCFLPARAIAAAQPPAGSDLPLLRGKGSSTGAPAAYVCRNYACGAALDEPSALVRALSGTGPAC